MEIIPNELLFQILLYVPEINTSTYKIINKRFNYLIKHLCSYYNKKFNSIVSDWQNNTDELIQKLVISKDYTSLTVLINNFKEKTSKAINFYAGYYCDLELIKYLDLQDYEIIAVGAVKNESLPALEYAVEHGADNLSDLSYIALKHGHFYIVSYLINKSSLI